jgi:putative transposase
MKNDFVSKGRSVSDLKAHLVLTTKYRRGVFTKPMLDRMHEIFEDLLGKWECKLVEFNGEENHVHLLFQYLPQLELTKLINNLKTVSSRRLPSEFEDQVNKFYYKDVLWNGSYFIASCGGVTVSTLRKYIENQDTPQD